MSNPTKYYHVFEHCRICPHQDDRHDMNCIECCPVKRGEQPATERDWITQSDIDSAEVIRMTCIKEPYASLVAFKNKVETRVRKSHLTGLVIIIATRKPYSEKEIQAISGDQHLPISKYEHKSGMAIGIAQMAGSRVIDLDNDRHFIKNVPENKDLFVWKLNKMTPIVPFEIKGFQGWRFASPDVISKIKIL